MNSAASQLYPQAKSLGILISNNKIVVEEFYGEHSRGIGLYYRPIGGSIEFGERSSDALIREFEEELGEEIEVRRYVGCSENIFSITNHTGHEIIQLFEVSFSNLEAYDKDQFKIIDGKQDSYAKWVDCMDFINGEKFLYPEELVSFLGGEQI